MGKTLFQIKTELNLSSRKALKVAQILGNYENIKIQENFYEALNDKNHALQEFFTSLARRAASFFLLYALHPVKVQGSLLWATKNPFPLPRLMSFPLSTGSFCFLHS